MKSIVLTLVLCSIILAVADESKKCNSNEDCGEDECCVHTLSFISSKCKKLRQEDEFCYPTPKYNEVEGKHRFMCPCRDGLECKPAKIEEKDGMTIYYNATCKPSKPNE
ncbi:U3-aranetoxin-Ce1a-like isoform X1 [Stegodyphus dumicola]|uniref:U3-aranetoxin-Ce1a-like isoform X1 n=1 Tax=Stegodyphus dumicola TaxID=202533 RepID=UPI0015A8BAF9|nr:U3-aranetoxin-Ce1a-like isoform X1 [Stegodyphus dumicola]